MQGTRVYKLLKGYRDRPAVDLAGVQRTLVALSRLVQDLAEVAALDINPLLVDEHGVVALDARVVLAPASGPAAARLAILPYPRELEETLAHPALGPLRLRPIRPEDEAAHRVFLQTAVAPADLRLRLGYAVAGELPHAQLASWTQIDYDREMCFIAQDAAGATLGNVRLVLEPVWEPGAPQTAEFALLVARAAQHHGLARALMDKAVRYARARGIAVLQGPVLCENTHMRAFCREFGFTETAPAAGDDVVHVRLVLN
jgi:acetyltransferase